MTTTTLSEIHTGQMRRLSGDLTGADGVLPSGRLIDVKQVYPDGSCVVRLLDRNREWQYITVDTEQLQRMSEVETKRQVHGGAFWESEAPQ